MQIIYATADLYLEYIKNSPNSTVKKSPINKRHEEDIQTANKCMKGHSTLLTIRNMQIETTIRDPYTPIRMAKIKPSDTTKC